MRDAIDKQPEQSLSAGSQRRGDLTATTHTRTEPLEGANRESKLRTASSASRFYEESVIGDTGMFILEDPGLQSNRAYTSPTTQGSRPHSRSTTAQPSTGTQDTSGNYVNQRSASRSSSSKQKQHRLQPREQRTSSSNHRPPTHAANRLFPPHQPVTHQNHALQAMPTACDYDPRTASPGIAMYPPRLVARQDSVTASSGYLTNYPSGAYAPSQAMHSSTMLQHYQSHPQSISAFAAQPQPLQPQHQMSEQEWQALRMQQMAHNRALQRGQMSPPP